MDKEKEFAYWLLHHGGLGPAKTGQILKEAGTFEAVYCLESDELTEKYGIPANAAERFIRAKGLLEKCRKEAERMQEDGINMVLCTEPEYPEKLRYIFDPPAALYYKGRLPEPSEPSAAVIGARGCTAYGRQEAEYFGKLLGENGIQVISGMAAGIDAAGHRGTLKTEGKAFAILGNGPEICYPLSSRDIYREIPQKGGGIISEYGPGEQPAAWHFPRRNRIISGLSDAVIVIEARRRSGSLITADLALEQGKDVFALPGRRTDQLSEGCNRLIRVGAGIITEPGDILDYFHINRDIREKDSKKERPALAKNEKMLYSVLDSSPKHLDELSELSGLSVWETLEALSGLEEKELAVSPSNQYYMKKIN